MNRVKGDFSPSEPVQAKPIKYEPQAIRPTATKNPSFFGFKNMYEDHELRNLSNPKLPDYSNFIAPKFMFGESDPQGFAKSLYQSNLANASSFNKHLFMNRDKREISNNSNISHSLIFKVR